MLMNNIKKRVYKAINTKKNSKKLKRTNFFFLHSKNNFLFE